MSSTAARALLGSNGADTLTGTAGNDVIAGGSGADGLTGGGGADTFALTAAPNGAVDRITDFVSGTDKLALAQSVFAALAAQAGRCCSRADRRYGSRHGRSERARQRHQGPNTWRAFPSTAAILNGETMP